MHGKGAYDAEGGMIKYYIRKSMRRLGRALTGAHACYEELVNSPSALKPKCPGHAHKREYSVSYRRLVEENGMPPVSLVDIEPAAAVHPDAAGSLRHTEDIFCVEFDDPPALVLPPPRIPSPFASSLLPPLG